MTKSEYCHAHEQLALELGKGAIGWEEFKRRIKELDNHEHYYERDATGDKSCWCGASQ